MDPAGPNKQTPPDSYRVPADRGNSEIRIQRSRFIGHTVHCRDTGQVADALDELAGRYHDCRHLCHAWRISPPPDTQEFRTDAGEPAGTAGEPILNAIRRRDLCDCLVVVARYFGGIKLGTGPLGRAYGQAAEEALAAAGSLEVALGREFQLDFAYNWQKTVGNLLEGHGGTILSENYLESVRWTIWLPHSTWQAFDLALGEATAGVLRIAPAGGV